VQSATYAIYVGYKDQVSNAFNDRSFSDSISPAAVKSSNTKQAVQVMVWPTYKLQAKAKARYLEYDDRAWVEDEHGRGILALAP
jgi:hypothetical protein